jgi:hypothetical protein
MGTRPIATERLNALSRLAARHIAQLQQAG